MKVLKLIGVLLDYPAEALWEHREELLEAAGDEVLAPARSLQLSEFVRELLELDPMAAQERWLGLFDRGRHMSLLLFEHVHGESRDRGQAMVDLIATYRSSGFELAARELPDYLPLVLEYLSQRPLAEARDWLQHTSHILKLLAARAAERRSPYAVLFEALVEIAEGKVELEIARRCAIAEPRDDTAEAMDQVWEEEAVRFGPEAPATDCKPPQRPVVQAQSSDHR
ncbi:nitrate reductase molybdenum cofactor assembly chaperone [Sinimarinibacterium sp. CAU 1509]|uniref:nitrate reductase molybdenum cofactor assembly chaperone n=1 Tax=Sinimarinibacterium sp. CAU 1509 TaxID=2562283 RepID=UPI0010ACFE2E|nr:nitrate reductase molybdenum cofactor assembly chaperone [Sinimarinibacterium sp. CAU 1509]TJY56246.1 nitrate reductase molybdenum cofactor assembly chaperone [Sinimarinibacterium sp. CAU 1509]